MVGLSHVYWIEVTGPASRLFGALLGRQMQRSLERENAGFPQAARSSLAD